MSIQELIERHVAPAEVLGDVSVNGNVVRACVAVTPTGPLVLMEFTLKEQA